MFEKRQAVNIIFDRFELNLPFIILTSSEIVLVIFRLFGCDTNISDCINKKNQYVCFEKLTNLYFHSPNL